MKLKLCIHRKVGAPGYGSDGAGAELEIEIDDDLVKTPDALIQHGRIWYGSLERMVRGQIKRMQRAHPEAEAQITRMAGRSAPAPEPPPVRGGGGEHNGYDGPPPRRNGSGGPPSRSGGRSDAPTDGRQLMGWSRKHGHDERLLSLAKQHNMGRIVELDRDQVDWLYRELTRHPAPGWGGGG